MIRGASLAALTLASVLCGGRADAQQSGGAGDAEADELTMTLITELGAATPDSVTRTIELPERLADEDAPADAERGAEVEGGNDTAEAARRRGRELGEEAAESARELRESIGRGEDGPVLPEPPAEPPGAPDFQAPAPGRPGD